MSWCCSECCLEEQEPGILSGVERDFPGLDETLCTYFQNELHRKKNLPSKVAVVYYDRKLTFAALHVQSTALANELKRRLGTPLRIKNPDDDLVICLCLPPTEKFIVLIFAILKIGGTFLPLDPNYPSSVTLQILKCFRPTIVVHEESKGLPDGEPDPLFVTVEDLWKELRSGAPRGDFDKLDTLNLSEDKVMEILQLPQETRANERPAVIIHTRGLHRVPVGVRISHKSIMNRIFWTWKNAPYTAKGSCCLNVPVTFVESLHQIFAPLLRGVTLNIYNAGDVSSMSNFIAKLEEDRITRISVSSVVLGKFLNECHVIGQDEARMCLKYLKYVTCKGEILTYDLARRFFLTFPADGKTLTTMYGYTELSGDVISERFKNFEAVKQRYVAGHLVLGGNFAQVAPNTKIYIMNVNREFAVNLEQGQICVGGTPLAMGYLNKKTKDFSFINNPYETAQKYCRIFLTGDYGRFVICQDRQFRLLLEGRGDSFLRHNGYEFVIDDIKQILKEHEGVDHVNLFIFHPGKPDQAVLAFILPKTQFLSNLSNVDVTNYLKEKVPSFMIPTIRVVESFPVLQNGRLDRHQLLKDYLEGRESGFDDWGRLKLKNHDAVDAGKILLEALYKFCSIPIKLSIKSLRLSFFALGGTSCNAVCLVVHLNKKGYPISIQDFIGAETIEDLINLMENRRTLQNFRKSNQMNRDGTPALQSPQQRLAQDSRAAKLYTAKYMEATHQREAAQIISHAYSHHGDLEKIAMVSEEQILSFLNMHWEKILEQQMCIVVTRNQDAKVVGTALCYDFFTDLEADLAVGPFKYVLEFGQEVKGQILSKLGDRQVPNEIYECFMMGTSQTMSPGENVRVIVLMLSDILSRALSDGFKSVFVSSTNQLVRDLLLEVFEFALLDDYVVNEYEENGIRPFHLAPGTLTISSYLKILKPTAVATSQELGDGKTGN